MALGKTIMIFGLGDLGSWVLEYVAREVAMFMDKTDPLWRSNATEVFSAEEYDRAFKLGTA
jgi:tRNA A37 threonylcarbamoyladenosine dehydratase